MSKPNDFKVERDVQAEIAAKNLEKYYAQGGDQNDRFNPNKGQKQGVRVPINLIILSAIFLFALFQFAISYHDAIVRLLPTPAKSPFLKFMQPFIDVNEGQASKEVYLPKNSSAQNAQSSNYDSSRNIQPQDTKGGPDYISPPTIDEQEFVQIKGKYFKYNPDNLYIVDGEKIFYLDSRRKK